jgi:hypothetical protein
MAVSVALLLAGSPDSVFAQQTGFHVVSSPFINNSSLSGAGAIASNDIWAVGSIAGSKGATQTLAEHFNGSSWSVVSTPSLNASLSDVAGAAGNDVWAVGKQASGSSFNPLIEHWNGSSWSVISSPKLPKGSQLFSVAAPASNNVWAVGGVASGSSNALVEHWNGSSWSIVSSPAFAGVGATAISADSSTDVWTVGNASTGGTASLHWNGQSWSQIPTVHLSFGGVSAVTALSSTNVWAVGAGPGSTGDIQASLIEHWNGSNWSLVSSPNPNPHESNSLGAIAAVSATNIWAVGSVGGTPFTERWNGTSWSIVSTPSGVLSIGGMTALSSGTVIAVGRGDTGSGVGAIILSS